MAGGQERILRRRIKSVQSTKKITRAMELIASSRIVRAQAAVRAAQPYSKGITEVVEHLAEAGAGGGSPLLTPREEVRTIGQIVIAADRGLCGGYNTTVLRTAENEIAAHQRQGKEYALVAVGRKVEGYFRYREFHIDGAFTGFSDQPTYENARAVAAAVTDKFLAGEIDVVQLVYTRFVSAGTQTVVVERLMPLETAAPSAADAADAHAGAPKEAYEFEPGPEAILDALLPRYAESRVFAALLNAAASEHAARQRAMKAATDNADELITSLSRVMNRARQEQITTEIMEIVGGAEALGSGRGDHDDFAHAHPAHLAAAPQEQA
ncbi:MAG TPA: F0F1 ATP synthase subunit gamma [Acidimicrobiia bacterium]